MAPGSRIVRWTVAVGVTLVLAASSAGCVGRTGGNDTDRVPGEQNPARTGDPAE